jgi:hypothetical protein
MAPRIAINTLRQGEWERAETVGVIFSLRPLRRSVLHVCFGKFKREENQ